MLLHSFKIVRDKIDKENYIKKYNISENENIEQIIKKLFLLGIESSEIKKILQRFDFYLDYDDIDKYINKIKLNIPTKNKYFTNEVKDCLRISFIKKYHISPEDNDVKIKNKVKKFIKNTFILFDNDFSTLLTNIKLKTILTNFIKKNISIFKNCNYLAITLVDATIEDDYIKTFKFSCNFIKEKTYTIQKLLDENILKNKEYINNFLTVYENIEKTFKNINSSKIFNFIQWKIYNLDPTVNSRGDQIESDSLFVLIEKIQDLLEDLLEEKFLILKNQDEKSIKLQSLCGLLNYLWLEQCKENKIKILNKYNLKKIDDNKETIHKLLNQRLEKNQIEEILEIINTDYNNPLDNKVFNNKSYIKIINEEIKIYNRKQRLNNLMTNDENKVIDINDIDIMSGYEFEKFISKLFIKMGYKSYTTKSSGDQGVDVIAENNDVKIAIQTKCYSGNVGNNAIQEIVAGKKFYDADKAIVITNSYFTSSAISLAKKNNIELWDRTVLKEKIDEIM